MAHHEGKGNQRVFKAIWEIGLLLSWESGVAEKLYSANSLSFPVINRSTFGTLAQLSLTMLQCLTYTAFPSSPGCQGGLDVDSG